MRRKRRSHHAESIKTSKIHLVIHLEFQVKVQIRIKKKIKIKIMILRESVIRIPADPPPLLKNLFWLLMGKRKQKNTSSRSRRPATRPVSEERFRKSARGRHRPANLRARDVGQRMPQTPESADERPASGNCRCRAHPTKSPSSRRRTSCRPP